MIPATQLSPKGKQTVVQKVYNQMILFNWGYGNNSPFEVHHKSRFQDTEIRPNWLKYQLVPKSRLRKLKPIKSMPNQILSLFAKIEMGKFLQIIYLIVL